MTSTWHFVTSSACSNPQHNRSFSSDSTAPGRALGCDTSFPKPHRVDLLDEALYQSYLARPGQLADELRPLAPGTTIVLDEIQRLPALLNEVHRFIEERRLRFVLCGSSARKLKQQGTNLLAGRALRRGLHPFVPAELGARLTSTPC